MEDGPHGIKYKEQRQKLLDYERSYQTDRLAKLQDRIADEQTQPWFHDYITKYENNQETAVGAVAPVDDDKE